MPACAICLSTAQTLKSRKSANPAGERISTLKMRLQANSRSEFRLSLKARDFRKINFTEKVAARQNLRPEPDQSVSVLDH